MKNEKSKALITQTIAFLAIAALAYGSPSFAKKPTGDTTPPGVITDLAVDEGAETFKTVTLKWTAPAEDGDSGETVDGYHVWCEPVGCEQDACGYGQCECDSEDPPAAPGQIQTCEVAHYNPGLVPNTEYWFTVRAFDDAGNVADWSNDVHDFTDSLVVDSWHRETVPEFGLDETLGHDFNDDGQAVIAGILGERYQIATGTKDQDDNWAWSIEEVPGDIMMNPYTWQVASFALDPVSGTAAFGASTRPQGQQMEVLYTYRDGSQWIHESVESLNATYLSGVQIAFDPDGNPAVAYTLRFSRSEVGELRLARKNNNGGWSASVVDPESGLTHPSLAFGDTPSLVLIAYSVEIGDPPTKAVRFATFSDTGWGFDNLMTPGDYGASNPQVIWNPHREDFDAGFQQMGDLSTCEHQSGNWACQVAFYGKTAGAWWLDIDDTGEMSIAYDTWSHDVNFTHSSDPLALADWNSEVVDYAWATHNFQPEDYIHWTGSHLALDLSGETTLSWMWNREIDYEPVERNTYFAWKEIEEPVCGDGTCHSSERCWCADCPQEAETNLNENCGDGIDNDCDGFLDADDDGCVCDVDGDTFASESCGGLDCDDSDPLIHPWAEEDCASNTIDYDCDGLVGCDDLADCADHPICAPSCLPRGAACTSNGECCSLQCHLVKDTCK